MRASIASRLMIPLPTADVLTVKDSRTSAKFNGK